MKYFAYGSNLDQMQMAQRCPSARLIGPAQLADHRLCFPRRSPVRECAVASIEPRKGEIIWGVLYELDEHDSRRLDEREGYDPVNQSAVNRYCRVDVSVTRTQGGRVEAYAYVAVPEDNPGQPSTEYLQHIIDGAIAHSFPDDYIEMLKAVALTGELGLSFTKDRSIEAEKVRGRNVSSVEQDDRIDAADGNPGDHNVNTERRPVETTDNGRLAASEGYQRPAADDQVRDGDG